MSVLRWEDPPPDRFRWKRTAETLREHPGRWARVLEPSAKNVVLVCARGLTHHGCEVRTRSVEGRGIGVWARWPESRPTDPPRPRVPMDA